jgi:Rps23 Pro-64 3,4-dihydroxylase Tpa1-like proline 4-hydroxylase
MSNLDWDEVGPGIVLINNIGNGQNYIDTIEDHVKNNRLSWVSDKNKKIDEDLNKKAMSTMYINNVRRRGLRDPLRPTKEEILHEQLFDRFERDFTLACQKYVQDFQVPVSQKEDYEILKYNEGNFFINHIDDGLFMTRKVSLVYYFNDNYSGGEIVFPRTGVVIKPKANQLALFPANYMYNHNVSEVTSGTRYSMVNWLK